MGDVTLWGQELFPNTGGASEVDGVELPFHGEASRSAWEIVEQTSDSVTLRTTVRLPLVIERSMRLTEDPPALRIEEVIRSDAAEPTSSIIGHHPAFLATEGARIDLPAGTTARADEGYVTDLGDLQPGARGTWPMLAGTAGTDVRLDVVGVGPVQRLAYVSNLGPAPWAAIRGVHPGLGVALAWDATTYPHVWNWWEIGGPEYPWYGRARIVALEPATTDYSDGLAAPRSRGQAHQLDVGATHPTWLTLTLFEADDRPVLAVDRDGVVSR